LLVNALMRLETRNVAVTTVTRQGISRATVQRKRGSLEVNDVLRNATSKGIFMYLIKV